MAEPKICSKNYVTADNVYANNGATFPTLPNLYDRDNDTQWVSVGEDNDFNGVTIDITFYEGTEPVERTIDTLILVNHNFKHYGLLYWDGADLVGVNGSNFLTSTDDQSSTLWNFTPVTTSRVALQVDATQVANAEKAIGELFICEQLVDLGVDMSSYMITNRQKVKTIMLADGSMHQATTFWAPNRSDKYEAKVGFDNVPRATAILLRDFKQSGDPFLWIPESTTHPEDSYWVHWTNPFSWKYSSPYKNAGVNISMDLKEV